MMRSTSVLVLVLSLVASCHRAGAKAANRPDANARAKGGPMKWLRPTEIDLGEKRVGKLVKARFELVNPTGRVQTITGISNSCGCQKVVIKLNGKVYETTREAFRAIEVPAGAEGELEVHVKIPSVGEKLTELRLHTTDPESPQVRVQVRVTGVEKFTVEQDGRIVSEVYCGLMTHGMQKEVAVKVNSRDGLPFKILGHERAAPHLDLRYVPEKQDGASPVWWVRGKLGPGLSEGGYSETVEFTTDRGEGFSIAFKAFVSPPIRVEPSGPLNFQMVPRKKGATRTVKLIAVRPDDRFEVEKTEVVKLTSNRKELDTSKLTIVTKPATGGHEAEVMVTLPPDLPAGMITGAMRITFAGTAFPPRQVAFLGFVRG